MKTVRKVSAGNIVFGDGSVYIQTMWDKPLENDLTPILEKLDKYKALGCHLIRFAVPDEASITLLDELAKKSTMPIVADIHFDYRLALAAMDTDIVKIRINPGNIGAQWKVDEIIKKALDTSKVIRIGVNSGSLPKELRYRDDRAAAMVDAVEKLMNPFEKKGFSKLVVSMKSSNVEETLESNHLFRKRFDYPLHLGITEAGPLIPALVKSSYALGKLLSEGIGETIRISISDDPEKEIIACSELLDMLKLGKREKIEIISCPKCGRTEFDTHAFTENVQDQLYTIPKKLKVAIMGCPVNGPGEAAVADLGITGSGNEAFIFSKGKIVRRVDLCSAEEAFWEELQKLL